MYKGAARRFLASEKPEGGLDDAIREGVDKIVQALR
jgi:hypothetical protein